jgi:rubrerythrin
MAIDLIKDKGTPLDRQKFTWRELVQPPYRKLNDDAFTRVRVILMNGIEAHAQRFSHAAARMASNTALRLQLGKVRRIEQHQQTMVNWLNPPDQNPLETTLGFEQVAIEVTAALAQNEPDAYIAQAYRFGLLEDFDHLYRFSALYDRLEGKDANTLLQSYTDILPGRPTAIEHRAVEDELRNSYDRQKAQAVTKLNALTLVAAENQTHDYYMTVGPFFADPVARQLFAEIASIEEQHVTHYESLADGDESWLEKWLLCEAMEVYNYYSCARSEPNARIRAIWERFVDYELGHLSIARELFQELEGRDVAEVLPNRLPEPIAFESQRPFIRKVLKDEVDLRANGTQFVDKSELPRSSPSHAYREQMNSEGSPSEKVAAGWVWTPGTELMTFERGTSLQTNGRRRS